MPIEENRYWIAVASRDHVQLGVKGNFVQANHGNRAPMMKLQKGDGIIYYSSKMKLRGEERCQCFTALGKIADDKPYLEKNTDNDFQPSRRKVEFEKFKEVPIRPLLEQLTFIRDIHHWGFPFRRGFFEISQDDFELIANNMRGK